MNDLKEAIDKLADKVTSLEAELHIAQESVQETKSSIPSVNYDAIQTWVAEEFGPNFKDELMTYIDEHYDHENVIDEKINDAIVTISEGVQNWATEEFAPKVQSWVTEEFAPEVQGWITEEYSPTIQNWITEEFAPVIDNWITEEYGPSQENKINENVSAFLENNKAGRLEEIDSLLETISADNTPLQTIVKENTTEEKYKGMFVIEYMPSEYKPLWEMLDDSRKDSIVRASRMYDFTKQGVLESFWANQDLTQTKETKVNENVEPINAYHQTIFQQMMRLRK